MNQLQEFFKRVQAEFSKWVTTLEESTLFERLVGRYDGLEPRQQKQLQWGISVLVVVGLCFVFLYPVIQAVGHRTKIKEYRSLIADIRGLGQAERLKVLSTQFPEGASKLPIASLDEAEMSLEQFLANIGIPVEFYKMTKSTSGFEIQVEELSVRQLQAFLFQIDAWYPQMGLNSVQTQIHPQSKEMLTMKASLAFGGASGGVGRVDFDSGDDFDSETQDMGESPPGTSFNPAPGNPAPGRGAVTPPAGGFNGEGDFESLQPPPLPPEFEGDGGEELPPPAFFEEE